VLDPSNAVTNPNRDRVVHIYYGAVPQFGNGGVNGCTPTSVAGEDGSGVNMLSAGQTDDLRFDTSQFVGGTFTTPTRAHSH
jgi:hypothetical protein